MTEFPRDFFKRDPVMHRLYMLIKQRHVVAEHTEKVLKQNSHIEDFCEEARHYIYMEGNPPIFLHYDVSSWYHPQGAHVRIDSIGVYDNFMEYESARLKGLHSNKSDIPNIN